MKLRRHAGFNLIEVMIALSMAATVLLALGGFIVSSYRTAGTERDRTYAMQRAMQMMAEIAAYRKPLPTSPEIDTVYDQATDVYSFAITTEQAVAYQVYSGNPKINGNYKYVRHIDVEADDVDPSMKRVTVSVGYAAPGATPALKSGTKPLAVLSNRLRVSPGVTGTTQVIDTYVISIENMPHLYRRGSATNDVVLTSAMDARLAFQQAMRQFTVANPGIELRPHFITRLSKGRDPYYRPYVNDGLGVASTTASLRDPLKWAYFYPGKIESASDGGYYYDPRTINGNILVGDTSGNGVVTGTGYALADQFNHCVPYEQEFDVAGGDLVGAAAVIPTGFPSNDSFESLSLRQFLEDLLNDTTGKYRNAVIVNLHGAAFPGLPLRPWADAAQDPDDTNAVTRKRRIVTHPYKLNFPVADATDDVRLLIHPYMSDGSDCPQSTTYNKYGNVLLNSTTFPDFARQVKVTVKGIKPYIAAGDINNIGIDAIQREMDDGSLFSVSPPVNFGGPPDAEYDLNAVWPPVAAAAEEEDATRLYHSGPHLASSHSAAGAPPQWGTGTGADDLVVTFKDFDYDAHKVGDHGHGPPNWYGMNSNERLHGLQYFPDPYLAFLDEPDSQAKFARNTARAIIEFVLEAGAAGKRFEVITQLMKSDGTYATPSSNVATTPDDPSITRTYFYTSQAIDPTMKMYYGSTASTFKPTIPWTEQAQLVGDPRENPYCDLREQGLFNHYFTNYKIGNNIYANVTNTNSSTTIDAANGWADIPGTTPVASNGHGKPKGHAYGRYKKIRANADISMASTANSWYGTKFDGPMYFRMWREAMYRNGIQLVNMGDAPVGAIALGGEFSLKGTIGGYFTSGSNVQINGSVYNAGSGAMNGRDEMNTDTPSIVRSVGGDEWVAKPWIGHLYPLSGTSATTVWSTWVASGNLKSPGATGGTFYRTKLSSIPSSASYDTYANRTDSENTKYLTGKGMLSLLNGGPSDIAVETSPLANTLSSLGTAMTTAYDLTLLPLTSRYPYTVTGGTGTMPNEYTDTTLRETLAAMNTSAYVNASRSGYSMLNPILLKDRAAAPPGGTRRAIFLANAFDPDSLSVVNDGFLMGVAGIVQTYYDSTSSSLGANNLKPTPRIQITSHKTGDTFTGNLSLSWKRTYVRPDGTAYSSTTYTPSGTTGPLSMQYFIKYKDLSVNSAWHLGGVSSPSITDAVLDAGKLPTGVTGVTDSSGTMSATWSSSGLPNDEYLVRVEGFRYDTTLGVLVPTHYAYQEIQVHKN